MIPNQLIVTLIVLFSKVKAQELETTTTTTTQPLTITTDSQSTTTELIVDIITINDDDHNGTEIINGSTELSTSTIPVTSTSTPATITITTGSSNLTTPPILTTKSTIQSTQPTTTINPIQIIDYTSDLFNDDCLNMHNQLRSRHGAGPLKVDANIINFARSRAATLASLNDTSYLVHEVSSYGENLAAWPLIDPKRPVNCSEVVSIWFNEYQYISNWSSEDSFTPYTYHFTQIVWSSTSSLGCGAATIKESNWLFICCNYDPPGNYIDSFIDHVKAPIDSNGSTINETINEVQHPPQIGKNCKCTCQVEL